MLRSKKVWLGLAVSALFLGLFLFRIDYSETFDALKGANYLYVAPAIVVYFGSLWFRTLRWQYLMKHLADVPMARLYPVTIVGYMANNIMPVRLGEVARSYYLSTRERMSASSALGTVGVDRVFDGLTLIFFILVVWPFLPLADLLKNDAGEWSWERVAGSTVVLVVFVGAIVVFVALTVRPSLTNRAIGLLLLFVPARFRVGVRGLAETFIEGLGSLDSAKKVLVIFIMSLPVWIMESLMYYLITLSFDEFNVSFALAMVVTATSNLVGALPAAPGNVGTFEWAIKATLLSFRSLGYSPEVSVAYAATLHVVLWLPVVVAGIMYLWYEHRSLMELVRGGPATAGAGAVAPISIEGDHKD